MGSDIIRLPNGKTVTIARARALGWVDGEGNFTVLLPKSYREQAEQQRAERRAQWRRTQRLDEPVPGVAPKVIEPLRPQNVKDGEPITDEALLAEIAAKTAEIEAANAKR